MKDGQTHKAEEWIFKKQENSRAGGQALVL